MTRIIQSTPPRRVNLSRSVVQLARFGRCRATMGHAKGEAGRRGEKEKMERTEVAYGGPCVVYTFLFPRLLRQDFAIVCYLASLYRLSRISTGTILLPRMKIRGKVQGFFIRGSIIIDGYMMVFRSSEEIFVR